MRLALNWIAGLVFSAAFPRHGLAAASICHAGFRCGAAAAAFILPR